MNLNYKKSIILAFAFIALCYFIFHIFNRNNSHIVNNLPDINVFGILYINNTINKEPIKVVLDNQPMCDIYNKNTECKDGLWDNNIGEIIIYSANNDVIKTSATRDNILEYGQKLLVVPPITIDNPIEASSGSGKIIIPPHSPYWCFYDVYNNFSCPGTGATIIKGDKQTPPASIGSRIEYNINDGQGGGIWFNSSAVDGVNANFNVYYEGCKDIVKQCNIPLSECPDRMKVPKILSINGKDVTWDVCAAPKEWNDINSCGLNLKEMAEASSSDPTLKQNYHKWWSSNKCAKEWLNYLQKNPKGICQMYGWAYDEKRCKKSNCLGESFNREVIQVIMMKLTHL